MALVKRYAEIDVTTTASTAKATPKITTVSIGWSRIVAVDLLIPPGHYGLTGWAVLWNGQPLIPWGDSLTYLIGNDWNPHFDVDLEVDQKLTIQTYNTDLYDHTHYARFAYTPVVLGGAPLLPTNRMVPIS